MTRELMFDYGCSFMFQRTFEDLGQPLRDVTFCVLDLETTGGSPRDCAITEIGAVKVRAGEWAGTFQTLVNPGCAVPPEITVLTGITQAMVVRAPRIESVLPTFLEFLGDAVVVGHNVRFDLSFLGAALERDERPRLANPFVDTCALARRLVRDEVPNCRLDTLATRLRLDHRPSHRALDDALATADLLHVLLERAGTLGVTGLDDLLALPTMAGHPQASKLRLTDKLPRAPGVYVFRDQRGEVLYVGKAANLRSRVRSYFSSDTRRKIGALLRETVRVDHRVCTGPLEAAVVEVRLIQRHRPRYNARGTRASTYTYVTLTRDHFPRLTVTRTPPAEGAVHVGPVSSARAARLVVEAIESAVPLRRCTARVPVTPRSAPCTAAQLGVATCPCSGGVTKADYADLVQRVVRGLTLEPELLLEPLRARMVTLASADRFEEAADVRDRADSLASALRRQRQFDALRRAGRLHLEVRGEGGVELDAGRLVNAWSGSAPPPAQLDLGRGPPSTASAAVPAELADELACVASWIEGHAARIRVLHCTGSLTEALPPLPSFAAREPRLVKAS
ncbi:MAG TPA: DEDD exonuclease domain-containing protein [Acidimicrobiales bacterium]|nr:DEDD exonuclease domain-containing protein [Acidimicrobiales bacterium]